MTKIGYAAMLEQFHPTDLLDWCAAGRGGRLRGRVHGQRALPSVDAAAGPERLRLGLHGRARRSGPALPFGTAVTCPGFRYHPAVIAHAAATLGRHVPGPLLARPGRRRGAQRARHRRRLARDRRPQRDDVRGDRDHQQALQRQGRQAQGRALHARERQALHAARSSRCRSTSRPPARSTPRRPASSPTG